MNAFEKAAQEAQRVAQSSLDALHAGKRNAALKSPQVDQWTQNTYTRRRTQSCPSDAAIEPTTGRGLWCDVCRRRPATLEDSDRPACLCWLCA